MQNGGIRSLFALSCALALAAILVSPAVPSPPTVIGKSVHRSVASQVTVAVLPGAFALPAVVLATLSRILETAPDGSPWGCRAVFLPLRR